MPIICQAVSGVDFEIFISALNLAYSDYFTPIVMSAPAFRALVARENIVLEASVAALDGSEIVGTGLLGIRNRQGWIGGMGVIPQRRRQGIGRQMMHFLIDRARDHQLAELQLEVIEANHGAHTLYREIGFEDVRHLLILSREPGPVPEVPAPYLVEEQPITVLLDYYSAFHDVPNCWQRGRASLEGLAPHVQGWAALNDGVVVGYAVGWVNEYEVRLVDFATRPGEERNLIAQSLLSSLHRRAPAAHGISYNIGENDPGLSAYFSLGYTTSFRQIEMTLALS